MSLLPQIEGNGLLHMAGFFPSVPVQINFELLYAPVAPSPPAPPSPAAAASAPAKKKPEAARGRHKATPKNDVPADAPGGPQ